VIEISDPKFLLTNESKKKNSLSPFKIKSFKVYTHLVYFYFMEKRNLKRIIQDLESLLAELKSEVYSDKAAYVHPWYEQIKNAPQRVHSQDDDGYAD